MSRVEDFLKMYGSKNTAKAYRYSLSEYFKVIYRENEHKLEEHADRYFTEQRNYEQDISNFLVAVKDKPPKTVRLMLAAVRSFLIENEVEFSQKVWRRLIGRVKGSRALTLDRVPINLELRKILTHTNVNGKALYLMLSSSGMRIGEGLKLKLVDFDFESQPCKVNIRGEYTKTGNSRVAFISREAVEAIQEWLKVRASYIQAAVGKSHRYKKNSEDERLFPFQNNTAYAIWKNALKKAGYLKRDASTNRLTVHPHVLRKFFRTKLGAVIPVDVTEALMGHEEYLTEVYRRYSVDDLAKFYLQGEPALLIFTEAEEVGKLRVEVEERNKQLQTLANGLATENLELKSRMAKMELENTDLKRRVSQTEDKLSDIEKLIQSLKSQLPET